MSSQDWLKEFKIALVDEDEARLDALNANMPEFDSLKQMQEAQAYIYQAVELLLQKQAELRSNMEKITKTKKFLNS